MPAITCIRCGKTVEVKKVSGSASVFVCKTCAEAKNLDAYKKRVADLEKKPNKTAAENRRLDFLKTKIK